VAATPTFLAIQIPTPLQRLANFAKSVWPADRAFVALLLGSILLLMSLHLGSWNPWIYALFGAPATGSRISAGESTGLLVMTLTVIYFAGAAALFVCFFPGTHPSKRLARWVYLPVAIGLAANFATVAYLAKINSAVPWPDGEPLSWAQNGPARVIHAAGFGIWAALLATALILYGDLRMRSGQAQLPVHLVPEFAGRPDGSPEGQVNKFIWLMLALTVVTVFTDWPAYDLARWIYAAAGHHDPGANLPRSLYYDISQIWQAATLFILLCVAMGSSRRETLKQSLPIPPATYLGLGIFLPTVVSTLLPILQYLFDRIHWAAYDFGRLGPPVFSSYFWPLPRWPYFFLILSALVEEIGWRGYLQPRFITRYGLYRGIFLVGIVWAVFHFPLDPYSRQPLTYILLHLVLRFSNCVAFGFALSWLTLRSRSVLPAALAHGFSNIFILSNFNGLLSHWTIILMWLIIDLLLFRFWPPRSESGSNSQELSPDPQRINPDDPPQHPPQLLDTPS
jgi:membrane protease YdiL (CAAX protease family)